MLFEVGLVRGEQILHMLLDKQGTAEDAHNLVDVSLKFHFVFDYCNETICGYCHVYLNSDSVLGVSQEGRDTEMLLYPFEEKLYLPAILIKKYNMLYRQVKVVSVEGECAIRFRYEGYDSADGSWIVADIAFARESDSLVPHYVCAVVKQVLPGLDHVFRMIFLPYNEKRVHLLNMEKPGQIPVSSVKYISSQRLIINNIESIHIMDSSIGNIHQSWNLSYNINLRMKFNPRLGASELRPIMDTHAKINGRGVKGIEFAPDAELFANPTGLCLINHMVGEILKDMSVPMSIAAREDVPVNQVLPKAKVKRLLGMDSRYIRQFTEATTSKQLSKHENQQLPPIGQLPVKGSVFDLVLGSILHDSFKMPFWQKVSDLAENVSSCMYRSNYIGSDPI